MAMITGVANSPCSWGVLEFEPGGEAPGYAQVLDEMAGAGYAGTELGNYGFMPIEPEVLCKELDACGLALAGAFVPVALADPEGRFSGEEDALRVARLLAQTAGEAPVLVLSDDNGKDPERTAYAGRIEPELSFSDREWEIAVHTVGQIALAVYAETGLRTAFHPHCAGYVETPEEVAFLMDSTDPGILGLCLDTAHCAYGGGDPLELVQRYDDRIWHVHFKGYDAEVAAQACAEDWDYFEAVHRGVFCELARSSIDFNGLVQELENVSYSGWVVVEQDVIPGMGCPLESATANREYLMSLGL